MTVSGKPKKKEKLSATVLAFREYERTSYYLATEEDFNFGLDDEARDWLHMSFHPAADCSAEIAELTQNRLDARDLKRIPAGLHVEGLARRTYVREIKNGTHPSQTSVQAVKKAAVKEAARVGKKKAAKKHVERDNEG